jgi:pyruvate dehydrogenase E1 component
VGVNWALDAQRILAEEWNVFADVWSVTSWNELRRDGLEADRHNLLHPNAEYRKAYVTQCLEGRPGPVIAVSDWMRAVQEQIREWVPQRFAALGTDGWGMSDTRGALRRHFLVDAQSIVVQTLTTLMKDGQFEHHRLNEAIERYQLRDASAADAGNTEGSG